MDSAGQARAANCSGMHRAPAFLASSDDVSGSVTATRFSPAWRKDCDSSAVSDGCLPFCSSLFVPYVIFSDGLRSSLSQPCAWYGTDGVAPA